MARFCTNCGKRLNDDEQFCTNCGTPAPGTAPGTVTLEDAEAAGTVTDSQATTTQQPAQPSQQPMQPAQQPAQQPMQPAPQPVYQPGPNQTAPATDAGTTQRWAVTGNQPVTPPAPTQQPAGVNGQQPKKVNPIVIAVIVIVAAAIIAGVVLLVVKPFGNGSSSGSDTKIEKVKTDKGSSGEGITVKNDPNTGKKIDDKKSEKNTATAAERDTYNKLSSYYGKLSSYDESVRSCATTFNQDYIKDSYSIRNSDKQQCENLRDEIESMYDEVNDMEVDASSKNYSSWKDIITLYDDLFNRIDVICDAWDVSCDYSSPEDHKDEIVAPLARDNISGTNDNKYRVDYEQRYEGAKRGEVDSAPARARPRQNAAAPGPVGGLVAEFCYRAPLSGGAFRCDELPSITARAGAASCLQLTAASHT